MTKMDYFVYWLEQGGFPRHSVDSIEIPPNKYAENGSGLLDSSRLICALAREYPVEEFVIDRDIRIGNEKYDIVINRNGLLTSVDKVSLNISPEIDNSPSATALSISQVSAKICDLARSYPSIDLIITPHTPSGNYGELKDLS